LGNKVIVAAFNEMNSRVFAFDSVDGTPLANISLPWVVEVHQHPRTRLVSAIAIAVHVKEKSVWVCYVRRSNELCEFVFFFFFPLQSPLTLASEDPTKLIYVANPNDENIGAVIGHLTFTTEFTTVPPPPHNLSFSHSRDIRFRRRAI
jgi:hypothetical protein